MTKRTDRDYKIATVHPGDDPGTDPLGQPLPRLTRALKPIVGSPFGWLIRHRDPQYRFLFHREKDGKWYIFKTPHPPFSLHHHNELVALQDYTHWLLNPDYKTQIDWRKPRKVLQNIGKLAEQWQEDMIIRRVSANYQRSAVAALRYFMTFVEAETGKDPTLIGIDRERVRRWMMYLEMRITPNTQASYYRRVAHFFNWAEREGAIPDNPFRTLRVPQEERNKTDISEMIILPEEIVRMFPDRPEMRAPMLALYLTGMRGCELWALKPQNVHLDHRGGAQVYVRKSKTNTGRPVPLCDEVCAEALMAFILGREAGTAPSQGWFSQAFGKESDRVLDRHHTMYSLRHSAITNWVQQGHDPIAVAKWAGTSQKCIQEHYYRCSNTRVWPGNPLPKRIEPEDPWPDRGPIQGFHNADVSEPTTTGRGDSNPVRARPDHHARGRRDFHSDVRGGPAEGDGHGAFNRSADGRFNRPLQVLLPAAGGDG